METIRIQDREYTFVTDFFDQPELMKAFNVLAKNTFDFELDGWNDRNYTCYALVDGETMAANVGVHRMDFEYHGERIRAAQTLTVMTAESYRKQGLSSWLMKKIVPLVEEQYDLVYLFANDTAVNFYPRFGFEKDCEYVHFTEDIPAKSGLEVTKLDLSNSEDRSTLQKAINQGFVGTSFPAYDADGLVEWLCNEIYADQIFLIEEKELVVVAGHEDSTLKLHAIFGDNDLELNEGIAALVDEKTKRVELGFTPKNAGPFNMEKLIVEGSTLEILNKKAWFDSRKIRVPQLTRT